MHPVVIAATIWGHNWKEKNVLASYCDNAAAVVIVNYSSARNVQAMQLRHCLAYHIFECVVHRLGNQGHQYQLAFWTP